MCENTSANLIHIVPSFDFSFVVITRNNPSEFSKTIKSIDEEAPSNSELVVIDGNDQPYGIEYLKRVITNHDISINYFLDEKKGIFFAQNSGVLQSQGKWIVVINAGDFLNTGTKKLLISIREEIVDAVIFAQVAIEISGKPVYKFTPTESTVWPHQSVVLKRSVYEKYGIYPTDKPYNSDIVFFAKVRKLIIYKFRSEVLTSYLLGGMSSQISYKRSVEHFKEYRTQELGLFTAILKSFISPVIRYLMERSALLRPLTYYLKILIYPYYSKPS